jgi:predicted methyltransferase MtxX (methanogen marker protein 4)
MRVVIGMKDGSLNSILDRGVERKAALAPVGIQENECDRTITMNKVERV